MTQGDFFLSGSDTPARRVQPRKAAAAEKLAASAAKQPHRIGFLLVPGFALMTYSCAMEPYRAANTLSGRELYRWMHVSPDGNSVAASNGVSVVPDQGIEAPLDVDELFVCAGGRRDRGGSRTCGRRDRRWRACSRSWRARARSRSG